MTSMEHRFLEPLDVLFMRGNKVFGDAGSHGESMVPPWPSVAAGALRSRILADAGINMPAFARGEIRHSELGTPSDKGSFTVTAFHLGRRHANGEIEILVAPPADLLAQDDGTSQRMRPLALAEGLRSSYPFPHLPVLAQPKRAKPVTDRWLTRAGLERHLAGQAPLAGDWVAQSALWSSELRVGVGLDEVKGRASDGQLFTTQAISMRKRVHGPVAGHTRDAFDTGFVVSVAGAKTPVDGWLRFGGDGRAAGISACSDPSPAMDFEGIAAAGRCRLILSSPGLFTRSLTPTGMDADGRFHLHGVRGRLACACQPRQEVVSGWDLARWLPKPAVRAVAAGSVYWLDELQATPESLRKLVEHGLWSEPCEHPDRRAEGFNRIWLGHWV